VCRKKVKKLGRSIAAVESVKEIWIIDFHDQEEHREGEQI
jgi:hypothetical protein